MNIGKLIRLNRLFAHPLRRFCSVAVDHFIGYGDGLPSGLRHMTSTLEAVAFATVGVPFSALATVAFDSPVMAAIDRMDTLGVFGI